jgi:hypothetical protein
MKRNSKGLSRRQLLKGSAYLGGTAAIFGQSPFIQSLARAHTHPDAADHYYIFCYFGGAWDVLLGLEPRDPLLYNQSNMRLTGIQPGYELLTSSEGQLVVKPEMTFGPHIGDLANHSHRLAVIRGMSMDTLTHQAGRNYFITGKVPSGLQPRGSSASSWLAYQLGEELPIPCLSVQVPSYNDRLPNYASALKVNSVSDLVRALKPSDPLLIPEIHDQIREGHRHKALCPNTLRSLFWQNAEASRKKSVEMMSSGLDSLFDFQQTNNPLMESIRDHYGIAATGSTALQTAEAQAAMAAQAIKSGISRCVTIQVASGLDTHRAEWADVQGPFQESGFNLVARLIEDLETSPYGDTGDSWLDHTTILGFSEFSRTALLNLDGGRDHSLTNSCFMAGAGIKGGTVVGRSSDTGFTPQAVNTDTGLVDPGGEIIRPEHVLQTLFRQADLGDEPDMRVDGINAIDALVS